MGKCRFLYNCSLEQRISAYQNNKKSLTYFDQCKELTQVRAFDPEYNALDATLLRLTSLHRLDKSFKGFFSRIKKGSIAGFPRFKARDRFDTLVFGTTGWKLVGRKLSIKGIGSVSLLKVPHRTGEIKGLRLVEKANGFYAQFVTDIGQAPKELPPSHPVGIDVGLLSFATLSDGNVVSNPRFFRKAEEDLAKCQRVLSSKKKGSNSRKKAKKALASMHVNVANKRKNFARQLVAFLVTKYDGFAVEKLKIKSMLEGGSIGLSKSIADAGWGYFFSCLRSKAEEAGFAFKEINPKNTTKKCSSCGVIVPKELSDREHRCKCGLVLDRDLNAAINIYNLGYRLAGDGSCGGSL